MERALIQRAKDGDREAFAALAELSVRRLYRVAQRIVRDADRAEDAVQQTLVTMWRELPRLRDIERFEAWTYRLVVRFAVAEARTDRGRRVDIATIEDRTAATRDDIGRVAHRDELERAFTLLTPDHRAVIVLHHYVGLSLGEIAEVLGVPYGTVGSRLHHATRSMRASLAADARLSTPEGQMA